MNIQTPKWYNHKTSNPPDIFRDKMRFDEDIIVATVARYRIILQSETSSRLNNPRWFTYMRAMTKWNCPIETKWEQRTQNQVESTDRQKGKVRERNNKQRQIENNAIGISKCKHFYSDSRSSLGPLHFIRNRDCSQRQCAFQGLLSHVYHHSRYRHPLHKKRIKKTHFFATHILLTRCLPTVQIFRKQINWSEQQAGFRSVLRLGDRQLLIFYASLYFFRRWTPQH